MSLFQAFRPSGRAGAILCAAALLAWPTPAAADLIHREDMQNGVIITRAQCAALPEAVWVRAMGEDFCIRYYGSTAGGEGSKPVVYLEGDVNLKKMTKPRDTRIFTRLAGGFSKRSKTTGIYLARPGYDGSSGHLKNRHRMIELLAINAALDAIKRKHRFDGFHLVGQSGGAMVIGGLLGMRRDIACAIPGAGVLARFHKPKYEPDPKRRVVNSADRIDWIVRNSKARILVLTDPEDKVVPYRFQTTFVERLRKAGGKVEQYFIEAVDDRHHGSTPYGMRAMAACVRGASPTEISADLAALRAEMLAGKLKKEESAKKAEREPPKQSAPRLQGT